MTRSMALPSTLAILILSLFVALPLYTMVTTAIKTDREIYDDFTYVPRQPSLVQFQRVLGPERFGRNIWNSVVVASTATVVSIAMSTLAAYSVVRLRFTGRTWVARIILFKYLLPTSLIYIPLFLVVNSLNL